MRRIVISAILASVIFVLFPFLFMMGFSEDTIIPIISQCLIASFPFLILAMRQLTEAKRNLDPDFLATWLLTAGVWILFYGSVYFSHGDFNFGTVFLLMFSPIWIPVLVVIYGTMKENSKSR